MQNSHPLNTSSAHHCPALADSPAALGSNAVRLSPCQWLIAAALLAALACGLPALCDRAESFQPGPDYRIPYPLASDYRLYRRYCQLAAARGQTLVVGDSAIWGHYVPSNHTLTHYLNQLTGSQHFANLGLDGTHPAALYGLLRYYAPAINHRRVILHLNPLWLSSSKYDLSTQKELHFNHPRLVPQFIPTIPCYRASCSQRISILLERHIPLFNWVSHLRIAYFESTDIPTWTLRHPYDNPLDALTFELPPSDDYEPPRRPARPTTKSSYAWVDLQTSLQWRFFKRSVQLLRERGNTVFVLIGPFNEHLLAPESRQTYQRLTCKIQSWLRRENILYYAPAALPANLYVDASHPRRAGYARLANHLLANLPLNQPSHSPSD